MAGPSTAISGVVRDAHSKTPLAGVTVKSQSRHGERISGWGQDFVRAVTDQHGRYRLEGMPIGSENRIAAIAPNGGIPCFSMSKKAATDGQTGPLGIDFELLRGVWIEGRITETRSLAQERDRQVRELEDRLMIMVVSAVMPVAEPEPSEPAASFDPEPHAPAVQAAPPAALAEPVIEALPVAAAAASATQAAPEAPEPEPVGADHGDRSARARLAELVERDVDC